MQRCFIFGARPVSEEAFERALDSGHPHKKGAARQGGARAEDVFIMAADAGWRRATKLGLLPDVVVGDFDSSAPPEARQAKEVVRLPHEKDDTDLHMAARMALMRGFVDITILGALEGRADQTMASMQTLLYLTKNGASARLLDERNEVFCVGGTQQPAGDLPAILSLPARPGRYLSVFAAGGEVRGVWLRGVKYPLENATLQPDVPLGVSNEFKGRKAEISCGEGYLYVMVVEKDAL